MQDILDKRIKKGLCIWYDGGNHIRPKYPYFLPWALKDNTKTAPKINKAHAEPPKLEEKNDSEESEKD